MQALVSCARRNGGSLLLASLVRCEAAAAPLLIADTQQHLWSNESAAVAPTGITSSRSGAATGGRQSAACPAAQWKVARHFTASPSNLLSSLQQPRAGEGSSHSSSSSSSSSDTAGGDEQPTSSGHGTVGSSTGAAAAAAAAASPAATGTWLDRLPRSWLPYAQLMRIDKPIGTWLLAWPCFWSIALAAPPGTLPDLRLMALFGAGAVLLRGAGCTVNDMWDRELDRQVERTRSRPLAAGTVTPVQAFAFLGVQLSAGLAILVQLNPYSQLLGASSLALVATYPLMKRITGWPQAFLGLTFNWGALLGWAAAQGSCEWAVVLPLYASGVCWTLVYDTIYAHQDKADDVKAGIRSTALTFGARTKHYCTAFAASNVALLVATGAAAGCGPAFYAGVAAAGSHLAWQIASVDLDDRADCGAKFVSNTWFGGLLFAGIMADRLALLA